MAKSTRVEAHGSLCDFLSGPVGTRPSEYLYSFFVRTTAKEAFEAAGIPHPEVDLLLVNDEQGTFSTEIDDGDVIRIYPADHPLSLATPRSLVRVPPLDEPRFLVDVNSGKLANALLILGFDTHIDSRLDDEDLARLAHQDQLILLSRDIGLLKRSKVERGYWLRSNDPRTQISEVIRRFGLWPRIAPLTRCLECNVPLNGIEKAKAEDRVPPAAFGLYDDYYVCSSCEKVFWKGSHYGRMRDWLADLEREFGQAPVPLTPPLSATSARSQASPDPTR